MQLIESVLVLVVLIQLIALFINNKEKYSLAFIGIGLLAFHFMLGESRWQMSLLYLAEVSLIVVYLMRVKVKKWLRALGCFMTILLTTISIILGVALPVFSLPETTGPYSVGLEKLYLKIEDRQELITADANDKRELMINVWYPSKAKIEQADSYLPAVERKGFSMKYGIPEAALQYLDKVETHNESHIAPADGQFPVLIFSPGFYTPASGYLSIIEEMVSHGYAVFNIVHPHETMGISYPDGRSVFFNTEFNEANSWGWNDEVARAVEIAQKSEDDHEKREATKQMVKYYGSAIVKRWATDIENVIDKIYQLNHDKTFLLNGKLDLDQLGVYGHSLGGAAAVEAAIFDTRIKGAVNLDGAQWGSLMDTTLNLPAAIISSTLISARLDPNKFIFENSLGKDFYNLQLENSGHSNFSDIPFMINLKQLNEAGSISPKSAAQSTTSFLKGFFNKYLLNRAVDLDSLINSNQFLKPKR